MSQWLFDESRKMSSSAGEYQSAGAGVRRVVREQGSGHVLPAEELEGPDLVHVNRILRVHDHPELPREEPEAEGVVRAADHPVVREVHARRDAGVGRRDERVGVVDRRGAVLRHLEEVVAEEVDGGRRVVELVDEQHVRPVALDDLGDVPGLPAKDVVHFGVRKVLDELAGVAAVQRGVERRKADVGSRWIGLRGRRERQQCYRGKQESSHECLSPLRS